MSDIQTLMRSANPIADAHAEFGQKDLDALLLLTQQRSGDMDVKDKTTPVGSAADRRRGWLVAVGAFAAVAAVVAIAILVAGPNDDAPPATTPTTTTLVEGESLGSLMQPPAAVAQDAGYEAESVTWQAQLDFDGFGTTCQAPNDPVDLNELDELTTAQGMTRLTSGEVVGHVEVLRFGDATVASQSGEILERLLKTRRECISSKLQFQLGNGFSDEAFASIEIPGTLGGYSMASTHEDGSAVAQVQAVAVLHETLLYIFSFSSNDEPVSESLLADMAYAVVSPPEGEAIATTTIPQDSTPEVDAAAVAFVEEHVALLNAGDHLAAAEMLIAARQFDAPSGDSVEEVAHNTRVHLQIGVELGSKMTADQCRTLSSGITQCRLSRTSAEIEPQFPHPETSLILVRLDEDGELAFVGLRPIETDPWWDLTTEFAEWALETYGTQGEDNPRQQVFVDPDPATYPTILEQLVSLWRTEPEG